MGSKKKSPPAAAEADCRQAIDDVCTVVACMVDGDNLDAPDVVSCRERLRLHREGRPLPGYPPRASEEESKS